MSVLLGTKYRLSTVFYSGNYWQNIFISSYSVRTNIFAWGKTAFWTSGFTGVVGYRKLSKIQLYIIKSPVDLLKPIMLIIKLMRLSVYEFFTNVKLTDREWRFARHRYSHNGTYHMAGDNPDNSITHLVSDSLVTWCGYIITLSYSPKAE